MYILNDSAFAAPEGITELIDATNKRMSEGFKATEKDLAKFKLNRRRVLAHSVVVASTAGGAGVGAIPIPIADAAILIPTEAAEVNAIARIYNIQEDDESKSLINAIVEAGIAGAAAKAVIGAIKAIPGINVAASVINAIVAGSIVFTLGEGSVFAFEKIYLGEKSISDTDWVRGVIEKVLSDDFIAKVHKVIGGVAENASMQDIVKTILPTFGGGK